MTTFTVLGTKTVRVEDNGMTYDVELIVRRDEGDGFIFGSADVFKIKKNGERGMKIGAGFRSSRAQVLANKMKDEFAAEYK